MISKVVSFFEIKQISFSNKTLNCAYKIYPLKKRIQESYEKTIPFSSVFLFFCCAKAQKGLLNKICKVNY